MCSSSASQAVLNADTVLTSSISLLDLKRQLEEADPLLTGHNDEVVFQCSIVLIAALEIGNDKDRTSLFI